MRSKRSWVALTGAALLAAFAFSPAVTASAGQASPNQSRTSTPIQHLVVIFQENVSFDHYFGTYPRAANTSGQVIHIQGNPKVNNLADTRGAGGEGTLLTNNPNLDSSGNHANPQRLDPANINGILT